MNTLEQRLKLNQSKYGDIFNTILDHMDEFDIYNLPVDLNDNLEKNLSIVYIEMTEKFLGHLIEEMTYRNYILILSSYDYKFIIEDCLNKSIYLRDRSLYDIDYIKEQQLCASLLYPISKYLKYLKNQILNKINNFNLNLNNDLSEIKVQLPLVKMYQLARPPIINKNGTIVISRNPGDLKV